MRNAALLVLVLLLSGTDVWAQSRPLEIPVGSRVRIFGPALGDSGTVGQLNGYDADSLSLLHGSPPRSTRLPFASITRMDVSDGRDRGRGMGVGALVGFGGGVVFGVVCQAVCNSGNDANFAMVGGVLWGLFVGAPIGALVGAAAAPER
jgi:hypothetical protein